MKAPLIAVISVGIAAAAPTVAVSADPAPDRPRAGGGIQAGETNRVAPIETRPRQPIGPASLKRQTRQSIRHKRLVRRFLRLRNHANRLIAKRDRRKPRLVRRAVQTGWSNDALARSIRRLRKRVGRIREDLRDRRAGLTPAVRAILRRIAACESKGNPRAIGGGGAYRGKYQFSYSAWRSVGGRGDPAAASSREQDRRAALLLKRSGTSPWPVCG
jgi:hypothetical protein